MRGVFVSRLGRSLSSRTLSWLGRSLSSHTFLACSLSYSLVAGLAVSPTSGTVEGPFKESPEIRFRPKLILAIVVFYFVIKLNLVLFFFFAVII